MGDELKEVYGEDRLESLKSIRTLAKSIPKWYTMTEVDGYLRDVTKGEKDNLFKTINDKVIKYRGFIKTMEESLWAYGIDLKLPSASTNASCVLNCKDPTAFSKKMQAEWLNIEDVVLSYSMTLSTVVTKEELEAQEMVAKNKLFAIQARIKEKEAETKAKEEAEMRADLAMIGVG